MNILLNSPTQGKLNQWNKMERPIQGKFYESPAMQGKWEAPVISQSVGQQWDAPAISQQQYQAPVITQSVGQQWERPVIAQPIQGKLSNWAAPVLELEHEYPIQQGFIGGQQMGAQMSKMPVMQGKWEAPAISQQQWEAPVITQSVGQQWEQPIQGKLSNWAAPVLELEQEYPIQQAFIGGQQMSKKMPVMQRKWEAPIISQSVGQQWERPAMNKYRTESIQRPTQGWASPMLELEQEYPMQDIQQGFIGGQQMGAQMSKMPVMQSKWEAPIISQSIDQQWEQEYPIQGIQQGFIGGQQMGMKKGKGKGSNMRPQYTPYNQPVFEREWNREWMPEDRDWDSDWSNSRSWDNDWSNREYDSDWSGDDWNSDSSDEWRMAGMGSRWN